MIGDVLIARAAGERFAVRAVDVQSVIELGHIVPVPRAPSFVVGLATQRSRTLTVIDVADALQLPGSGSNRFALVIDRGGVAYALGVDMVESVASAADDIRPMRIEMSNGWARCAAGMIETAVGTVLLVELDSLIDIGVQQEAAWQ